MNFKPSTFYISIIDIFAILLPGSIASLIIYHFNQTAINAYIDVGPENTMFFTSFVLLFSSYLFGHIISQVSAYMDVWIYDSCLLYTSRCV